MSDSSQTLLVYASRATHRVRYICKLLFSDLMGLNVEHTSEAEAYQSHEGPKVNYSNKKLEGGLFIMPTGLLFSTGIDEQEPQVITHEGVKCLFPTHERSTVPFDPLAASFFMVSRYEEYLPHISDTHSRFEAKDSLAYRKGFLRRPVVNLWANMLKAKIAEQYPNTVFAKQTYKYVNTIDVDNAWAYKEKGLMRTMGGFGRAFTRFDMKQLGERFKVLYASGHDPYDTYEYMLAVQKEYNLDSIYFFLLADYGHNDKNVPFTSRKFQSLIKFIADYAKVGIHPSYGSNTRPANLKKEIGRLAEVTRREVTRSRQHFLKLTLPDTYRRLLELDIEDDYTMGFASEVGFRAGICTPYFHYDLDQEQPTPLRIHPFAMMDGTLNEYMHLSPEEAIATAKELIGEVRAVNGTFISLWHNETLNDRGAWKGWREVYEQMVEAAAERSGKTAST